MKQIIPLGDRVLVQRAKPNAAKGKILLPDTAQEKPKEGIVKAVGPGKVDENGKLEQVLVKVGDKVLFSAYAGTEVKNQDNENGDEYLILSQTELLGVLS